jgi:peptide/nickel transport system substrate-binding protein
VNPTIQGIYQSVFDQYINQDPGSQLHPGLLTEWGWTDDNTKIRMVVREGVTWHNGDPFTAEDVVWSLERAGNAETGNPIQFVWSKVGNFADRRQRDHRRRAGIRADAVQVDGLPDRLRAAQEILRGGRRRRVRGRAHRHRPLHGRPVRAQRLPAAEGQPDYWGGAPAFETVTLKFVTDASSRVAEVESGASTSRWRSPTRNTTG